MIQSKGKRKKRKKVKMPEEPTMKALMVGINVLIGLGIATVVIVCIVLVLCVGGCVCVCVYWRSIFDRFTSYVVKSAEGEEKSMERKERTLRPLQREPAPVNSRLGKPKYLFD